MSNRCDCPPYDCKGLVARYLAGDRQAGEELCRKFEPLVRALVARVLGPARRGDWEDAYQAIFLHLLERFDRWGERCPFCKWLAVVATRRAIDLRRVRLPGQLAFPDAIPAPRPTRVDADLIDCISRKVQEFPPDWRLVWERHMAGILHEEIAAELKKSPRTVQYRLAEIRERLASCLGDDEPQAGRNALHVAPPGPSVRRG